LWDQFDVVLESVLRLSMVPQLLAQLNALFEHLRVLRQETQTEPHHLLLQAGVHDFDLEAAILGVVAQHLARFPELLLVLLDQGVRVRDGVHVVADLQPLLGGFVVILAVKLVQWFVLLETFGLLGLHFE